MKLDDLKARLQLIAAWHKPGGPTPKEGMPNRTKTCLEAAQAITDLEALVGELGEALRELEQTEADYRHMHDLHGSGSFKTGRRWDWMRRAGDKARATLAKLEKARG